MINYFFKRLFTFVLSLALASIVIFSLVEIAPGDPASFMLGINAQEDTISALRTELGLDQPKISRYFTWIGGMLTGDFGISYTYRTNVTEMVGDRLWVSLPLAIYSLVLSTVIAIPTGIYAATKRGKTGDVAVISATQFGIAVPNFWFAIILVGIFAIKLVGLPFSFITTSSSSLIPNPSSIIYIPGSTVRTIFFSKGISKSQ